MSNVMNSCMYFLFVVSSDILQHSRLIWPSHIPDNSHNHYLQNCMLPHWLRCVDNSHILLNLHTIFAYFLCELSGSTVVPITVLDRCVVSHKRWRRRWWWWWGRSSRNWSVHLYEACKEMDATLYGVMS